jgi:hypothetical protein
MRVSIWVALLFVAQLAQPLPRQAIGKDDSADQKLSTVASSNKNPPAKATPVGNSSKTAVSQSDGDKNAKPNESNPIHVVLLPVDVKKDWTDYVSVLINLLLTVATLVIALYATKQASAAKRSADNDEVARRLTQRADVLLALIELQDGESFSRATRVVLHLKNYGPTRADEVVFDFRISIGGVEKTGSPKKVPIVLGGGDDQPFIFRTLGEITTNEIIDQIVKGTTILRIFGKITYKDVFGVPHVTECGSTFNASAWAFSAEETHYS